MAVTRTDGSAADRAYHWTKARILAGEYRGRDHHQRGHGLRRRRAVAHPSPGRFLRLASEGSLTLHPKRGALVVPVSLTDTRDVVEARPLIEPWAVRLVASARQRPRRARR